MGFVSEWDPDGRGVFFGVFIVMDYLIDMGKFVGIGVFMDFVEIAGKKWTDTMGTIMVKAFHTYGWNAFLFCEEKN